MYSKDAFKNTGNSKLIFKDVEVSFINGLKSNKSRLINSSPSVPISFLSSCKYVSFIKSVSL